MPVFLLKENWRNSSKLPLDVFLLLENMKYFCWAFSKNSVLRDQLYVTVSSLFSVTYLLLQMQLQDCFMKEVSKVGREGDFNFFLPCCFLSDKSHSVLYPTLLLTPQGVKTL